MKRQTRTAKLPPVGPDAERLKEIKARRCRECGCTEMTPCTDPEDGAPCFWVERELCSTCAKRLRAESALALGSHPLLLFGTLQREARSAAQLLKELPQDQDKYYGTLRILVGCLTRARQAAEALLEHAENGKQVNDHTARKR